MYLIIFKYPTRSRAAYPPPRLAVNLFVFLFFLMLKRLFFEPWNGMKNRWKMDQKSTKNQSKMDQTSIKNRPKSSIQNTPADAQPRTETHSQGLKKSSCRRTAKPPCRRTAKDIRNFPADAQSAKQWENTVKWEWAGVVPCARYGGAVQSGPLNYHLPK